MLRIGKITACLILIFGLARLALAAEVSFSASVDKNSVALDDTVQYTLEIKGDSAGSAPSPALPKLINLTVVGTYQSSNISIINGQMSVAKSFVYTLRPEKTGQAHIGSASVVIGGRTYATDPIDIQVTKAAGKSHPSVSSGGRAPKVPGPWDDFDEFFKSPFPRFRHPGIFDDFDEAFKSPFSRRPSEAVKDPIQVDLRASQTTVYVNQQVILTFTFYRRVNLFQSPQYSPPDTTGFWAVNLPTEKNVYEVSLKGVRYLAQDFKTALFPMTAGNYTIGPATLIVQTDPFASPQTIKTQPLKIRVLPLPEAGKPATFSGAVGDYKMDVALKQDRVERGQPVQITAKIWGRGNIQTITEPVSALPQAFKKLSATGREDLVKDRNGVSGSKSFDIVLIPLKEGPFTLPPFEFSYFDPIREKYVTLKSRELTVTILPSKAPLPPEYEQGLKEEAPKKPLQILIPWEKIGRFLLRAVTSLYFWLCVVLLGVLAAAWAFYRKYRQSLEADPVKRRQKQALKVAKQRLKKANRLLKRNELKAFLSEIFHATAEYLGDKFGFSATGLTTDELRNLLGSKGLNIEAQQQLENFMMECDLLRFTPSSLSREKAMELSRVAERLIVEIEKSTG